MKALLLLLAIAANSYAEPQKKPPVGVPADAKFFNGKWYRVYLERLPWNRAVERCKQLGGSLVIIPDTETWTFVKGLTTASVWLGATDEKTEGVWIWNDGTAVAFTDWFTAQPDNSRGIEHYISTYKGQWNDSPKSGEFMPNQFVSGFVCQWSK